MLSTQLCYIARVCCWLLQISHSFTIHVILQGYGVYWLEWYFPLIVYQDPIQGQQLRSSKKLYARGDHTMSRSCMVGQPWGNRLLQGVCWWFGGSSKLFLPQGKVGVILPPIEENLTSVLWLVGGQCPSEKDDNFQGRFCLWSPEECSIKEMSSIKCGVTNWSAHKVKNKTSLGVWESFCPHMLLSGVKTVSEGFHWLTGEEG